MKIEKLRGFLTDWTQQPGRLQPEIANYLKGHFLAEELRDWDVSRPAPYFGFEILGCSGKLLVRLVRRADRLHGCHARVVRRAR